MSTRQLRKLQKQREAAQVTEPAAESSEGSDEDGHNLVASKPRGSLFAALGGEDMDAGDNDDDEDEERDQDPNQSSAQEVAGTATPIESSTSKKKAKRKKKKKAASVPAVPEPNEGNEESEDEIDRAIKDLNISARHDKDSPEGLTSELDMRSNDLLKINPYHLRAINEMRNLFGRDVMESANMEEEQDITRRHRQRLPQQVDLETYLREPPGAPKLPEVSLRRNIFVQGKEHWPKQTAGGLTMKEIDKSPDNGRSWTEYAYVHDKNYDEAQAFFFACVTMGDPMRMVRRLKEAPYHVSTLLQVSSVAKQDQNMALAAELCERALFTFGRVATTAFRNDIEQGRARLDFRRPENRQFWLAGYHYLRSLIRKGTYRTALEWARLLYALDPTDPYSMRHYIHFLAIRAYEAQWLIDFLDQIEKTSENRDTLYIRQTLVLAKLQMRDDEGARNDLQAGMQRLPWLYCALFQDLGLDTPPAVWGIHAETDTRSFWVKLYIHQTKDLWNNSQATTLLQAVAKTLDRVDVSALPTDDPPVDLGSTRLAYLEGETSLIGVAPRHFLESQPNYEFDPLPPPEDENIFTSEGARLPWRDRQTQTLSAQNHMLERLQNRMQQGPRVQVGAMHNDDDDDFDEQRMIDMDDEELRRDLEAHAIRGDEPGMMQHLLDLMGLGRQNPPDEGEGQGQGDGLHGVDDGGFDEQEALDMDEGLRRDLEAHHIIGDQHLMNLLARGQAQHPPSGVDGEGLDGGDDDDEEGDAEAMPGAWPARPGT